MNESKSGTYWRSVFAKDEVIQRVRPHETKAYLRNPHKGCTTFQRFNGDPLYPGTTWSDKHGPEEFAPFAGNLTNPQYPDTTISYCRWLWSVFEPEQGHYRWELMDGALAAARARGQTLQARIQPYIGDDLPPWFWTVGGVPMPGTTAERHEPDHNHPSYLKHWGAFVRAFGARYDGHPDLESFDIAYGGPCGECGGNATPETAARLVDVYLSAFPRTQLLSMLGTPGCAYGAQLSAAGRVPGRPLGWRADCYGDLRANGRGQVPDRLCWGHMYDAYPKEVVENGVTEAWRTAPVTFETCWTVGHWYEQKWDIDWILEQGLKYHPTVFMPKSSYVPDAWREKVEAFCRRLGYRLVPRQLVLPLEAKPGQTIAFTAWIDNVGVAPLYAPYRLAFRFRQPDQAAVVLCVADPRRWLPEHTWFREELVVPPTLRPGEAKVDIGLVDPATLTPRVRFAITEVSPDGWHPLTSLDIL